MSKPLSIHHLYIFQKKLYESLYPNNPRVRALDVEAIRGAKREEIIDIAHRMTANAADFTFVFVGNVDLETLKPLVEQYIATLPANAKKANKKITKYNPNFSQVGGRITNPYNTPMTTPQTWAYISVSGKAPYTMKNAQLASVAAQILSSRLVEIVREKEGAVYSISAQGSMDRVDPVNIDIVSAFPMKPEMKEKVLDIIAGQIDDLSKNIDQTELDKVKEYMVKSYNERKERNNGWLSGINGWLLNGVDTFNGDVASISSITVDDVKNFMKALNSQNNYHVIILDPKE